MSKSSDEHQPKSQLQCGAQYEGHLDENGEPEGHGRVTTPMRLPGGDMYLGELQHGEPDKNGRIIYTNGFKFKGEFMNGYATHGVVMDSEDTKLTGYFADVPYLGYRPFTGFFVKGHREGYGVETYTDGATREGSRIKDMWHGAVLYTTEYKKLQEIYSHGKWQGTTDAGTFELQSAAIRRLEAEQRRYAMQLERESTRLRQKQMDIRQLACKMNVRNDITEEMRLMFDQVVQALLLDIEVLK